MYNNQYAWPRYAEMVPKMIDPLTLLTLYYTFDTTGDEIYAFLDSLLRLLKSLK